MHTLKKLFGTVDSSLIYSNSMGEIEDRKAFLDFQRLVD